MAAAAAAAKAAAARATRAMLRVKPKHSPAAKEQLERLSGLYADSKDMNRHRGRVVRGNSPVTNRTDLIEPDVCEKVLDNMDLSEYEGTHIVEMNPGTGLWAEALHRRLRPKHHTLLEPHPYYQPLLRNFVDSNPAAHLVRLNGYDWETYDKLFDGPWGEPYFESSFVPPKPATVPPEHGVNTDLLFTGNITIPAEEDRLVAQFLTCCALKSWVQRFGRVRFLLWVHDHVRERYLPESVTMRARMVAASDALVEINEVASSIVEAKRGKGRSYFGGIWRQDVEDTVALARAEGVTDIADLERVAVRVPFHKKTGEAKRKDLGSLLNPLTPKPRAPKPPRLQPAPVPSWGEVDSNFASPDSARWIPGMVHPPWYYYLGGMTDADAATRAKAELKPTLRDEDVYVAMDRAAASAPRSRSRSPSPSSSGSDSDDTSAAAATAAVDPPLDGPLDYAAFERTYNIGGGTRGALSSVDEQDLRSRVDEVYARVVTPPLLQKLRAPRAPFMMAPDTSFFPPAPLTLLSFTPVLADPFFRADDAAERMRRWEAFSFIVQNLFVTRARGVREAMEKIAPGAENVIDDAWLDGEGKGKTKGKGKGGARVDGDKRVRLLSARELVALTRAWMRWPFKPVGIELDTALNKGLGSERPLMKPSTLTKINRKN